MLFSLLSFFWFIRETKAILFWIYLWQLKEYHIGRFIDHFQTEKGKRILFNKLSFLKIILIVLLFISYLEFKPWPKYEVWLFFLLILYFLESAKGFFDFFQKKLLKPIFTFKTIFLIFFCFIFLIFSFLLNFKKTPHFLIFLISFDILSPGIFSGILLFFQPASAIYRWIIIKKAKRKREKFKNLLVIGITGSYGKTSTKEFLAEILSKKFKVLKTSEHQNSEIGISQCILNDLKPKHEIFIVEMGAYNRGGIKLLCDIVKPKIGILTGINEQHMATFGSLENIIRTKYELIESLPKDGIAFFNAKNEYCFKLYQKTKIRKKLYGQEATFPGEENILGSIAVAKETGMTEEEISRVSQRIKNKFPGIEVKKGINELNIIDATYSANPDGVVAHLEYLRRLKGKKIIVMPCLIELGPASKEVHKRIGRKIGQVCDSAIITTKEHFKEIKEGAIETGMPEEKILFLENPKKIFERIKNFCKAGDAILLEGRVPKELIKLFSI